MPGPSESGLDFASVLAKASQLPEAHGGNGQDLPGLFPGGLHQGHHRVVDTSKDPEGIPGIAAYEFKAHREVFLIYRPYDDCARCKNDLTTGLIELPAEGDYRCPHTHKLEYEETMNKILEGKFLYEKEAETFQKDGTMVVSLKWYEKKIDHKKLRALQKAAASGRTQNEPSL